MLILLVLYKKRLSTQGTTPTMRMYYQTMRANRLMHITAVRIALDGTDEITTMKFN